MIHNRILSVFSAARGARDLAARFRRAQSGTTLVEFSLLIGPFVIVLFATIEIGFAFFANQTLETAVTMAARQIRTGEAQTSSLTQAAFKQLICTRLSGIMTCDKIKVDVRTYSTFDSVNVSTPTNADGSLNASGFQYSPGTAGSIVVVRAFYEWPVIANMLGLSLANTGNGTLLLTAVTAFKNEPFPSSTSSG